MRMDSEQLNVTNQMTRLSLKARLKSGWNRSQVTRFLERKKIKRIYQEDNNDG